MRRDDEIDGGAKVFLKVLLFLFFLWALVFTILGWGLHIAIMGGHHCGG